MNSLWTCPCCGTPWPNRLDLQRFACPGCGRPTEVQVFPRLLAARISVQAATAGPGDARCFDHPDLRAEHTCERCGRLLCPWCTIEMDGHIHCGHCCTEVDARQVWRTVPAYFQYDSLAWVLVSGPWLPLVLWLVLAPLTAWLADLPAIAETTLSGAVATGFMFGWMSLFTAPVALWLVVRYRRQPASLLPRTRVRWWLAGIGAVLLLIGWIAFFALTAVLVLS